MTLGLHWMRLYALAACLAALVLSSLVAAIVMVESVGQLVGHPNGTRLATELLLYGVAECAYLVFPVAMVVSLLVLGTQLARSGECLAAQALGLSPGRMTLPFVVVATFAAVAVSLAAAGPLPQMIARRDGILRDALHRTDGLTRFYGQRPSWFRRGDTLLYVPQAQDAQSSHSFDDPVVYRWQDGFVTDMTVARCLRQCADGWHLEGALGYTFAHAQTHAAPQLPLALQGLPTDLLAVVGNPRHAGNAALLQLIVRREAAGLDATPHRLEAWQRLGHAALAWALVWLVAPWALWPQRRRSVAASVGAGAVLLACTLGLGQLARLLALAHRLPPGVAALAVPVLVLLACPVSLWAAQIMRSGRTAASNSSAVT